jgi:hypothetical protein
MMNGGGLGGPPFALWRFGKKYDKINKIGK